VRNSCRYFCHFLRKNTGLIGRYRMIRNRKIIVDDDVDKVLKQAGVKFYGEEETE